MNRLFTAPWNLATFALKNVTRYRLRSLLTILGVGLGMFLFTAVEALQSSVRAATESAQGDQQLVVFRENRFCPATSRLPEDYERTLAGLEGVARVIPVQIVVNNCGTSLDVVTFRGVPPASLMEYNPALEMIEGSAEAWRNRSDAALIGHLLAARRGLQVGDNFDAAGITIHVAGIIESPEAQDNNVAYVHLPFLQQTSRAGLGTVTQFNVLADEGENLEVLAERIDLTFVSQQVPTSTRPEKAFFAETAHELVEISQFTRWIGLGAVIAVLGLVANSILLVVRGRVREHAVLQTLGYSPPAVGWLVSCEGLFLGLLGGLVGVGAAFIL